MKGLRVTKSLWTLIDLLDTPCIDHDYVLDALRRALDSFAITQKKMNEADLDSGQRQRLIKALKEVKYEWIHEIRK